MVLVFQALSSGGSHQTAWAAGRSGSVFASHVRFVVFSALVFSATERVSEASAHKTKLKSRFSPPFIVLSDHTSHFLFSDSSVVSCVTCVKESSNVQVGLSLGG